MNFINISDTITEILYKHKRLPCIVDGHTLTKIVCIFSGPPSTKFYGFKFCDDNHVHYSFATFGIKDILNPIWDQIPNDEQIFILSNLLS